MVAMFKREVTVKGTVIEYSGSDAIVERINCTDRIEEELVVQVGLGWGSGTGTSGREPQTQTAR